MPNHTLTITLGAGDKGKQWDQLVRYHAKKNRMSMGAFIRLCIYDRVKAEMPKNSTPDVSKPAAAVEQK